jgi:hypothetical protein
MTLTIDLTTSEADRMITALDLETIRLEDLKGPTAAARAIECNALRVRIAHLLHLRP